MLQSPWRRENETKATQQNPVRGKVPWSTIWYLRTLSSTLNLFLEAHWLYISSFLDLGTAQPWSPPTSNSVHVTKQNWLDEKQRITKRRSLQQKLKLREAIFLDLLGSPKLGLSVEIRRKDISVWEVLADASRLDLKRGYCLVLYRSLLRKRRGLVGVGSGGRGIVGGSRWQGAISFDSL